MWPSISLTLVIVGLIGNVLSIVVFTRPNNRMSSSETYFTALAISDILNILNSPSYIFFIHVYKFDYRARVLLLCKICGWLADASVTTSSWLLVAVTMERVIRVVVVIWCIIYSLNSHHIYGSGKVYDSNNISYCGFIETPEYNNFAVNFYPWIDLTIVFAVPFCFIFFGNIVVIINLTKTRKKRNSITTSKKRTVTSVQITLVMVNITFILLMSPLTIFFYLLNSYYLKLSDPVIYRIIFPLNVMSNANASVNFFLYILSGAKFRADVKGLFQGCIYGLKHRQTRSLNGTIMNTTTHPIANRDVGSNFEKF